MEAETVYETINSDHNYLPSGHHTNDACTLATYTYGDSYMYYLYFFDGREMIVDRFNLVIGNRRIMATRRDIEGVFHYTLRATDEALVEARLRGLL